MGTARSRRFGRQTPRRHRDRTTRLRVEQLEDRLTPSLTAGGDVPGELLIRFQPGVTTADIADFYADHGLSELKHFEFSNDLSLKLVATPTPQARALIPTLQQDPRVRYAELNVVLSLAQVPNDPDFPRDYGLRNTGQTGGTPDADIDADEAWDITTGSSEIVVAVMDSGVDYTHPDLAANMWTNPGEVPDNGIDDDGNGFVDDYHGYDFFGEDSDPMDDEDPVGHGTRVAGVIGMVGDNAVGATGVNWNVQIMALKIGGSSGFIFEADVLEAYAYVVMMRNRGVDIRVVNESWGGPEFSQAIKDASDAMGQAGILDVAIAHNFTQDNDVSPIFPASFDSPHIISVAATDRLDRIALFSNWGATSVDLAAPGEFVWTTVPGGGYDWSGGTSFAAPHVAGAAALVWSAFPDLTAQEVKARLLGSVDPIGHIGWNATRPTLTNGRLNVRNALLVPGPDDDATPPAAIANLAVSAGSPWSVTLTWTAVGDDGATGRAGFYDVRYSSSPITAANWAAATPATAEPAPRLAGASESFTVTGLDPDTLYYFAVKVQDNAHNESALSNLAQGNTTAANYLLNDDVEQGEGNWSRTGLWHRSDRRGHDSANAWYYGRESTGTYETGAPNSGTLTLSSPLDLTNVSQAQLRFHEFRQPSLAPVPERALVQVSGNGVDWITVVEEINALFGWEQRTVDLTPFTGGPLHLRFVFDSNDAGFPPEFLFNDFEGWYVDNIRVSVPAPRPPGFSINDVTVTEGHDGTARATFTVTRSNAGGDASVHYATADGRATAAGGDYLPSSGELSFGPGETRKTVTVLVNGDRLGEEDESFVVRLSNPTGAAIADGEGTATILDDEPRIFFLTPSVLGEGGDKGKTPFEVQAFLTVPSPVPVTVQYRTEAGTARAGDDYVAAHGTLMFNPGETVKTVTLELRRDARPEPVEKLFLELRPVSGNVLVLREGVVYIIDDDPASAGQGNSTSGARASVGASGGPRGTAGGARSLAAPSPTASTSLLAGAELLMAKRTQPSLAEALTWQVADPAIDRLAVQPVERIFQSGSAGVEQRHAKARLLSGPRPVPAASTRSDGLDLGFVDDEGGWLDDPFIDEMALREV